MRDDPFIEELKRDMAETVSAAIGLECSNISVLSGCLVFTVEDRDYDTPILTIEEAVQKVSASFLVEWGHALDYRIQHLDGTDIYLVLIKVK